jgi:hypothetical protein
MVTTEKHDGGHGGHGGHGQRVAVAVLEVGVALRAAIKKGLKKTARASLEWLPARVGD